MPDWEASRRPVVVAASLGLFGVVAATAAFGGTATRQTLLRWRKRVLKLFRQEQDPGISLLKVRNEAWIKATIHVASCEAGFRRLVREHVQETDGVLELGCHCGTTTALARTLCRGTVVGVDTSDFNLDKARTKYVDESITWCCMDATDSWAVRRACMAAVANSRKGESASCNGSSCGGPDNESGSAPSAGVDCSSGAGETGEASTVNLKEARAQRRHSRKSRREERVVASMNRRLGSQADADQQRSSSTTNYPKQDTCPPMEEGIPSVVLLDISGSRAPGLLMQVIESYDRVFQPRIFIVKSYKLFSFVSQSSIAGGGARV